MIKYRLRREGNDWGPPRTYNQMIAALKIRLKESEGPFRVRWPDSNGLGPPKTRYQVINIISNNIQHSAKGDIWKVVVDNGKGDFFSIQLVLVGLPEKQPVFDISDGSPAIQKVARVAAGYDAGVRTAGIAYTRLIAGTNSWSQHSRWPRLSCKGNAIDLYFPLPPPTGNDLPRQRRLVQYLLAHAADLNLNMIISERTYWSKANGFQPRYYSGVAHVGHTHIEIYPAQSGSPCR